MSRLLPALRGERLVQRSSAGTCTCTRKSKSILVFTRLSGNIAGRIFCQMLSRVFSRCSRNRFMRRGLQLLDPLRGFLRFYLSLEFCAIGDYSCSVAGNSGNLARRQKIIACSTRRAIYFPARLSRASMRNLQKVRKQVLQCAVELFKHIRLRSDSAMREF